MHLGGMHRTKLIGDASLRARPLEVRALALLRLWDPGANQNEYEDRKDPCQRDLLHEDASLSEKGVLRRRLPVAAKMALATAGPVRNTAASPKP